VKQSLERISGLSTTTGYSSQVTVRLIICDLPRTDQFNQLPERPVKY